MGFKLHGSGLRSNFKYLQLKTLNLNPKTYLKTPNYFPLHLPNPQWYASRIVVAGILN